MPKRKRNVTKAQASAQASLDATLRKYGIDPSKRPTLRGIPTKALSEAQNASITATHVTSDTIPGNSTRQDRTNLTYKGDRVVGQLGNKQGFGLLNKSELGNSKRRDR